jgi:hypothetical protein
MNEEPAPGPGVAVLVIPMPGGMAVPTDTVAAMIAFLYRHGGPRTGEVLTRLERQGWTLELPDPATGTQTELWASARFADVAEARTAARPFQARIRDVMRWAPVDRPGDGMLLAVEEPPDPWPPARETARRTRADC